MSFSPEKQVTIISFKMIDTQVELISFQWQETNYITSVTFQLLCLCLQALKHYCCRGKGMWQRIFSQSKKLYVLYIMFSKWISKGHMEIIKYSIAYQNYSKHRGQSKRNSNWTPPAKSSYKTIIYYIYNLQQQTIIATTN